MTLNHFFRILIRWAILVFLLAKGLLLIAGSTHLRMLNAYIAIFVASLLVMMVAIGPRIAQQPRQAEKRGAPDRIVRTALVTLFIATIVMAALDVGRLHISNHVPIALNIIGLALFGGASGFQAWAMSVNSFYSPLIHIQADRGHSVVTRGPYRFLRHPAYFANIVAVPASALAIGSWVALIPAAVCCAFTVWRARREDTFLRQHLVGYKEYIQEVPGGVLPHLSLKL